MTARWDGTKDINPVVLTTKSERFYRHGTDVSQVSDGSAKFAADADDKR